MSDVILRGLMLPESRVSVSNTSNTNNNSVLKGLQLDETENQGAQSLRVLDSLKLSESTGSSSKGSIPIQLMSPDDIGVQQTSVKPNRKSGNNSTFNALANLKPSSTPKPKKNDSVLTGLNTISVASNTQPNQGVSGLKIPANYSTTTTSGVSAVGKVGAKINTAIEKIQTWDRKMGILDSEIEKQKSSGESDPSKVITRTSQMATAKKDAVISRDDAMKAYKDAMTELNETFGSINSANVSGFKNSYLKMEAMFAAAQDRDKTVMDKSKDFLKAIMTPENFNRALNYLNPFN
jgi:hypothetical protein